MFVLCYLGKLNLGSCGTRRLVWTPKCIFCTIAFGARNLSNRTGTRNRVRTLGQCRASKQVAKKRNTGASVKSSGAREQREDEDQGRESEVDVDVPGSAGFAANVFRVGIAGGVRTVCRWICGYRFCGRKPVHAAPRLGIGRGAHRGEPASGYGGHAAGHRHDRRRGAQNDSASGFCASPLGS